MRTIEQQMINAIIGKKDWKKDNTQVIYTPECVRPDFACIESSKVYLHGHHIATVDHRTGKITANPRTLSLWPTATTKSRLRALGVDVTQSKGRVYLDGEYIADAW